MAYLRVIPRDLFNEGNLLKCYGKLSLLAMDRFRGLVVEEMDEGAPFEVSQDENGCLSITNLRVYAGSKEIAVFRPLNARSAWPLWVEAVGGDYDIDHFEVFTEEGDLSPEMLALLGEEVS